MATGGSLDVRLTTTVTDGDGDVISDSATVTLIDDNQETFVTFEDDGPVLVDQATSTGVVEEEELPGGIEDTTPAEDLDTPGVFTNTTLTDGGSLAGMVDFGTDGPGGFAFIDDATSLTDQSLTSDGTALFYTVTPTQITATAGDGGAPVFTLTLDQAGNWNFTLQGVLDHPTIDQEDLITIDFSGMVQATDGDGDGVTLAPNSFTVSVIDDVPMAENNEADTQAGEVDRNIVFVFDRSGSMDDDPGVAGFSERIDWARAAVASLLTAAGQGGVISVLIVDFSDTVGNSGWLTGTAAEVVALANAYLASLEALDSTFYDIAAAEVQNVYGTGYPGNKDVNLLYWLSDGNPEPANRQLDAGEQAAWEGFLSDPAGDGSIDPIRSIGVGIGGGVDGRGPRASLLPGRPGEHHRRQRRGYAHRDPAGHLAAERHGQRPDRSRTGHRAMPSTASAPTGRAMCSLSSWRQGLGRRRGHHLYLRPGARPDHQRRRIATIVSGTLALSSTTSPPISMEESLDFNFISGAYNYGGVSQANGGVDEVITYSIVDNDGDTSTATLTISLDSAGLEGLPIITGGSQCQPGRTIWSALEEAEIIGGDAGADTLSGLGGDDLLFGGKR